MAGMSAHGTQIYWSTDVDPNPGPIAGTIVGEITSLSGPTTTVDTIDVTSHDSEGWREFVAGLGDFGELRFDINFHPAYADNNQMNLFEDMVNNTMRWVTIQIPADPNWVPPTGPYYFWCPAYCIGFEISAPFDDKLSASITLKLSGVPQYAPSTPDYEGGWEDPEFTTGHEEIK